MTDLDRHVRREENGIFSAMRSAGEFLDEVNELEGEHRDWRNHIHPSTRGALAETVSNRTGPSGEEPPSRGAGRGIVDGSTPLEPCDSALGGPLSWFRARNGINDDEGMTR